MSTAGAVRRPLQARVPESWAETATVAACADRAKIGFRSSNATIATNALRVQTYPITVVAVVGSRVYG